MAADARAVLELVVDVLESGIRDLKKVRKGIDDVDRAVEELNRQDIRIDTRGLDKAQAELEETARDAKKARDALRKIPEAAQPGKLQKLVGIFNNLKTAVGGFLGAIVVRKLFQMGEAVSAASIDLERMKNGLEALEGVEAAAVLERIAKTADALGTDLEAAEQATTSFVKTAVTLGLTLDQSLAIIEGFSAAAIGAGKGTLELNRALIQLEQGLAKGKFEMQDLKIIMEAIPGVSKALADGLGITTEELFKLQSRGLIPAKEAALILAAELPKLFSGALVKNAADFRSELQRVKNEIFETGREIGESIIPEMEEWLRLFKALKITGTDSAGAISGAIKLVSDELQSLVRLISSVLSGDLVGIFDLIANRFDQLQILLNKGAINILKSLDLITGGTIQRFKAAIESAEGDIKTLQDRIARRAEEFFILQVVAEDNAARERQENENKRQAERDAFAEEAKKTALARIRGGLDDEEKELKASLGRQLDLRRQQQADLRGLFGGGDTATDTRTTRFETEGETGFESLDVFLEPLQKQLEELIAKRDEFFQAGKETGELQQQIDNLSNSMITLAQGSIPAAKEEFGSFAGVVSSSGQEMLDRIQALVSGTEGFREAVAGLGENGRDALQGLINTYTSLGENTEITKRDTEAFRKGLVELFEQGGAKSKEFADDIKEAGGESTASVKGISDSFQALLKDIEPVSDEISKVKGEIEGLGTATDDVSESAPEAAEGVGKLGKESGSAVGPVGELQDKTAELATDLKSITAAAGPLVARLPVILSALTENADGLLAAVAAGKGLSESLPVVAAQVTLIQQAVTLLSSEAPALLKQLAETQDKGVVASLGKDLELVAKGTQAIGESSESLKAAIDALIKGGDEKEKINDLAKAVERLADPGLVARTKEQAENFVAVAKGLSEIGDEAEELGSESGPISKALEKLKEFEEFLRKDLGLAVDAAIEHLGRLQDSLGEVKSEISNIEDQSNLSFLAVNADIDRTIEKTQELNIELAETLRLLRDIQAARG